MTKGRLIAAFQESSSWRSFCLSETSRRPSSKTHGLVDPLERGATGTLATGASGNMVAAERPSAISGNAIGICSGSTSIARTSTGSVGIGSSRTLDGCCVFKGGTNANNEIAAIVSIFISAPITATPSAVHEVALQAKSFDFRPAFNSCGLHVPDQERKCVRQFQLLEK
jgi:hypothetical protein